MKSPLRGDPLGVRSRTSQEEFKETDYMQEFGSVEDGYSGLKRLIEDEDED
jgi:hypothetical protein